VFGSAFRPIDLHTLKHGVDGVLRPTQLPRRRPLKIEKGFNCELLSQKNTILSS